LQDANFIAEVFFSAIEEVGVDNVVQVITDSAKACSNAGELIMEK
jgi:hypothetical protein